MKKITIIAFSLTSAIVWISCSDVRRSPGMTYMPDMAYSRAYETYALPDSTEFTSDVHHTDDKIFYNNMPVAGTIARGEEMPFTIAQDKPGDTVNYFASKAVMNPVPMPDSAQMVEARRLYLINCGICHGKALDGNGPLWKGGDGPFPAAPKNLVTDAVVSNMPDGQMFYSITYGKNLMGSYASQLTRTQRWMIIHYIKSEQAKAKAASAPADATAAVK